MYRDSNDQRRMICQLHNIYKKLNPLLTSLLLPDDQFPLQNLMQSFTEILVLNFIPLFLLLIFVLNQFLFLSFIVSFCLMRSYCKVIKFFPMANLSTRPVIPNLPQPGSSPVQSFSWRGSFGNK